ncbi:hypothetical protein NHQ30_004381 [Ciborinia camelliae]|nr:hypothetical protein NHQ30_004381 [Ciborinia camelliae]
MVKFSTIALFLITSAISVQACTYCQCLFSNGDHCCLTQDPNVGDLDCKSVCSNVRRKDGTSQTFAGGFVKYGTPCGSSGNYKCASMFEAENRARCA